MKQAFVKPENHPLTKERINDTIHLMIPVIIYGIFYLSWFFIIESKNSPHYTVMDTTFDYSIPFLEIFVVPYYCWFLYIIIPVAYFLFKYDLEDYFRVVLFMTTGMTLFLIISTLFPNIQYLRPTEMPRDNIFCSMVESLYKTDTPTNLWPSIHVYNSIGVAIAVNRSKRFHPGVKAASNILCVLIILSTVFIKQHTIFDVLTAFILAIVMYVVAYRSELVDKIIVRHEIKRDARVLS